VGVTIVVVAYAVVPPVVHFVSATSGYNPLAYEPKDEARLRAVDAHARSIRGLPVPVPLHLVANVLLVLLVALVWLALVPPGVSRR
jgi:hypothetical protein